MDLRFWPNSVLVLLWDQESTEDALAKQALHERWDAILREKDNRRGLK